MEFNKDAIHLELIFFPVDATSVGGTSAVADRTLA
jgi:hypothetical protein